MDFTVYTFCKLLFKDNSKIKLTLLSPKDNKVEVTDYLWC